VKKTIRILKKPTSSVRFRFYKSKIKKTKLNLTEPKLKKKLEKKLSQIGKNRASRFEPVLVFFRKKLVLVTFFL